MADAGQTWVALERDRVLIAATGDDRSRFLQGMLSNEVESLKPGQGVPALVLTEQGRITASLQLMVDEGEILLDLSVAAAERLVEALERFIVADDIDFEQRPVFVISLGGKDAASTLGKVVEVMPTLAASGHAPVRVADMSLRVVRGACAGGAAFRLFCSRPIDADRLAAELVAAGAHAPSAEAIEARRIAAGIAQEGVDFDTTTLAPEVPSLTPAISRRKGCYLGQEVIERVAARGKVRWLVTRVTLGGPAPVGASLLVAEKEIGILSSVAVADEDGAVAAIARVRRENVEEESCVDAVWDGGSVRGSVLTPASAEE